MINWPIKPVFGSIGKHWCCEISSLSILRFSLGLNYNKAQFMTAAVSLKRKGIKKYIHERLWVILLRTLKKKNHVMIALCCPYIKIDLVFFKRDFVRHLIFCKRWNVVGINALDEPGATGGPWVTAMTPGASRGLFCVKFAFCPHECLDSLWAPRLSPTKERRAFQVRRNCDPFFGWKYLQVCLFISAPKVSHCEKV